MIKTLTYSLVLIGMIGMGCKAKKNAAEDEGNTNSNSEMTNDNEVTPIIVDKAFQPPKENDSFDIKSMEVDGDTLKIDLSYSGGCEDHEFELYFNGLYKKSLPPKATFFLKHDANGDACRSYLNRTLKFNIKETRFTAGGNTELIINLNETDKKVAYTW